jgi:hypothetical protein
MVHVGPPVGFAGEDQIPEEAVDLGPLPSFPQYLTGGSPRLMDHVMLARVVRRAVGARTHVECLPSSVADGL